MSVYKEESYTDILINVRVERVKIHGFLFKSPCTKRIVHGCLGNIRVALYHGERHILGFLHGCLCSYPCIIVEIVHGQMSVCSY